MRSLVVTVLGALVLPSLAGTAAAARPRTVFPNVRAIALSDRRVRWPAIKRAGAFSVLPRSATHAQLGRTIAVAGGH